ncbi:uncharacterized protein LOC141628711 [Silene latifolia]|uniref:uncharacterized protein LOC141628711 n=1 Tax=Silene latifolia TaxID=37657 RepID=UPI003D770F2F
MAPFEAFYWRRCRGPICGDDSAEIVVLGPRMVQDMVDQVKLIRQKMNAVAYRLALLPALDRVHNVFHVSLLWRYVNDPSHVLEVVNIKLDEYLSYLEVPKEILDRKVRKTGTGETVLLKVLWSNHNVEEATWEAEEAMKERYPILFYQIVYVG